MDFNPANGELWFTDNQVDGMGDDIPPGELNRQTAAGQNFGFPWYGGGDTRTNEYKDSEPPEGRNLPGGRDGGPCRRPRHDFYTGSHVPREVSGGIFSAQHGSWNRTTPVGARVMFTAVNEDGGRRNRRSSPTAGSTRTASISAGRSTSRSCATARSWCPTISSARSTASPTATDLN
jgi:glucose/arabinose dehydrogenase